MKDLVFRVVCGHSGLQVWSAGLSTLHDLSYPILL